MPSDSLAELAAGFRLPWVGARLLLRERRLWAPALVPLLLSLGAFALAASALLAFAGPLHRWLTAWMPSPVARDWLSWLWVGPAQLGLALLGVALFLAAAAVCLAVAFAAANLLASPFHDALAARVERLVTGREPGLAAAAPAGVLRDAARALREELRRTLFFAGLVLPIAALGWLLPPAQVLTAPALLGLTLWFSAARLRELLPGPAPLQLRAEAPLAARARAGLAGIRRGRAARVPDPGRESAGDAAAGGGRDPARAARYVASRTRRARYRFDLIESSLLSSSRAISWIERWSRWCISKSCRCSGVSSRVAVASSWEIRSPHS